MPGETPAPGLVSTAVGPLDVERFPEHLERLLIDAGIREAVVLGWAGERSQVRTDGPSNALATIPTHVATAKLSRQKSKIKGLDGVRLSLTLCSHPLPHGVATKSPNPDAIGIRAPVQEFFPTSSESASSFQYNRLHANDRSRYRSPIHRHEIQLHDSPLAVVRSRVGLPPDPECCKL